MKNRNHFYDVTYAPDVPMLLLTQPLVSQAVGRYRIIHWEQMIEIP